MEPRVKPVRFPGLRTHADWGLGGCRAVRRAVVRGLRSGRSPRLGKHADRGFQAIAERRVDDANVLHDERARVVIRSNSSSPRSAGDLSLAPAGQDEARKLTAVRSEQYGLVTLDAAILLGLRVVGKGLARTPRAPLPRAQ